MPHFDAILFDFDGVLLDSEPLHCACWAKVLAPFGVKLDWEYYRDHYLGVADRDMIPKIAAGLDPPVDAGTLWAEYPNKRDCLRRCLEHPPFSEQLAGLLAGLWRQYKLAVVSTSARVEVEPPLVVGGIRQYFEAVVTGEDTERHKPEPDPYLYAARLINAKNPLVIEDSAPGIASGQAAGFEVLAVTSAAQMPEQLAAILAACFRTR
jgi:beta-phosphoglucomutase